MPPLPPTLPDELPYLCWICRQYIPEGEFSKDHILPRRFPSYQRSDKWLPACKECNNARGNLSLEIVLRVQHELNDKHGLIWGAEHVRYLLRLYKNPQNPPRGINQPRIL